LSAYENALIVSMKVDGARRNLALDRLLSARGIVLIGRQLALRPGRDHIKGEVILPHHATRSAQEFQVAIAGGVDLLARSPLSDIARLRRLEWLVVDDYGTGRVQLWPRT